MPARVSLARRVMQSRAILGIGLCTFVLSGCQKVVDDYCALRLPSQTLLVDAPALDYRLDHQHTAQDLSRIARNGADQTSFGLTEATPHARIEVAMHAMSVPGGVCARPDIHVTLSYAPVQVHMASELAPDSCAYNTIFGHELKHVQAYRAELERARATLVRSLAERFPDRRVLRYRSMDEAHKDFDAIQDQWLAPRAQRELDAVAELQVAIDSPEEYARLDQSCGGLTELMGVQP